MKKSWFLMALLIVALMATGAQAATFGAQTCLKVDASPSGLVTVSGSPADVDRIKKLVQYCPDKTKGGCSDNRIIGSSSSSPGSKSFQMNTDSVRGINQRAFNFKGGNGLWLAIPNSLVQVGSNLILEMSHPSGDSEDGRGGAHFVFMSDGYTPLYPIAHGGEACVPVVTIDLPKAPVLAPRVIEKDAGRAEQNMSGQDNKVDVKGNDNDVTPQNIKQQAKQKTITTVKGNNNVTTVKKKITQIGVNAKSTGSNSPVTVIVNPDGTTDGCSATEIKRDANGNVVQSSSCTQKKATEYIWNPYEKYKGEVK